VSFVSVREATFVASDERSWLVAIAIHDRVGAHVREGLNDARWGPPHVRRAHRPAQFFQLPQQELNARNFVRPPPVVGQARRYTLSAIVSSGAFRMQAPVDVPAAVRAATVVVIPSATS
jgi:hypothetical protein